MTSSLIAQKLDELGIDYIEGGWPGSNPKDKEFFARARRAEAEARQAHRLRLHALRQESRWRKTATCARWSKPARRWSRSSARPGTCTCTRALGITEEENLKLISETVKYLKDHGKEVVYDAEHFFDGYAANPDYALRTLEAAQQRRRRRALPVRHQRRHAHRPPGRRSSPKCASASTASSASTRITIPTWPWPTPSPPWKPAPRTCRAA